MPTTTATSAYSIAPLAPIREGDRAVSSVWVADSPEDKGDASY
jgi:hypothetical protein